MNFMACGRFGWAFIALFASLNVQAGEPLDVRVGIDARLVAADADEAAVSGGNDRTRFDNDHEGFRFGSAWLRAQYRFSDAWTARADVMTFGDGHGASMDATQLFLQYRPYPTGPLRWEVKVGAFYPELSMENRGPAWTPVYTLTPSALNTWYGEELRTIGVETQLRWLGASSGYNGDVGLVAGVYGWNDPIGTLVALRGWAPHDRQTGLWDTLAYPEKPGINLREFREIDGRPGFYAGLNWRHGGKLDVRALRYDNRADPGAFTTDYAWLMRFNSLGARWEVDEHWTVIGQALKGDTSWGPPASWEMVWDMDAWYAMVTSEWGPWRYSLRREGFGTRQTKGLGILGKHDDSGHAWTASATWTLTDSWQLLGEWLQVDSTFKDRIADGRAAFQRNRQFQLALRYQWHY